MAVDVRFRHRSENGLRLQDGRYQMMLLVLKHVFLLRLFRGIFLSYTLENEMAWCLSGRVQFNTEHMHMRCAFHFIIAINSSDINSVTKKRFSGNYSRLVTSFWSSSRTLSTCIARFIYLRLCVARQRTGLWMSVRIEAHQHAVLPQAKTVVLYTGRKLIGCRRSVSDCMHRNSLMRRGISSARLIKFRFI